MDGRYTKLHRCGEGSLRYPQSDCKYLINMAPNLNKEQNRNTETNLFDESVLECTFQIEPYLPYEFTCEGMLQRVNTLIENQVRGVLIEGLGKGSDLLLGDKTSFVVYLLILFSFWPQDFCTNTKIWPPLSVLQVVKAEVNTSCKQACREKGLICEPAFFPHLNSADNLTKSVHTCCFAYT